MRKDDAPPVSARTDNAASIALNGSGPPPELTMHFNLTLGPLISLIAGILILVIPRLLNFIVAIYLIIIGLLGLFGTGAIKL
jgi:hypothetical protein